VNDRHTTVTWDDIAAEAFRITVDRAARGVATDEERTLLRKHADILLADLDRARRELADRAAADSADAAAGSYALRAEGAEQQRDQARATNRRLNLRAQQLESELAAYRRAVDQWEISERGTYVPLRTITAIAKAAGRDIENPRWLLHYQRVEQAEAAILRIRNLAGRIRQGVPWTANDDSIAAHILRAVDGDQAAAASCSHATPETEPNNPRTTGNNSATSSNTPDNPLEERIRAAIEREVYEYRERATLWGETEGVTEEIARLATRGALEALGMPAPARLPADAGTEFIRQITEGEDDGLDGAWAPDPPIRCVNLSQAKEQHP
jgi:hypothetical protein